MQYLLQLLLSWTLRRWDIRTFSVYKYKITYNGFSKISIREPSADGLVDEEYVCIGIPRIRIVSCLISANDIAWAYIWIKPPALDHGKESKPSSVSSPRAEDDPGPYDWNKVFNASLRTWKVYEINGYIPPFVQSMTSSLAGSFLLSKK